MEGLWQLIWSNLVAYNNKGCEIGKEGTRRIVVEGTRIGSNVYNLKEVNPFTNLNVVVGEDVVINHMGTKVMDS